MKLQVFEAQAFDDTGVLTLLQYLEKYSQSIPCWKQLGGGGGDKKINNTMCSPVCSEQQHVS